MFCVSGEIGVPGVLARWDGIEVDIAANGVAGTERVVIDIPSEGASGDPRREPGACI